MGGSEQRLDVRPVSHDFQMQQHFAGAFAGSGNLVAVHIDGADIFRLHETFADHCRRAQNFIIAHSNTDVAVVGSGESLVINPPPDFADFFLE